MVLNVPRCLDITRLARRAGRVFTGVDRVELAYLVRLLAEDALLFGLCRTALGYVVLDRAGLQKFSDHLAHDDWGKPDLMSRLSRRSDPQLASVETSLRRWAIDRARKAKGLLPRCLPPGVHYLNVGHTQMSADLTSAIRTISGAKIGVMVHDTIPLDFPQYQRPETLPRFDAFFQATLAHADVILANSDQTRLDILRHASTKPKGKIVTAWLGIDLHQPKSPPKRRIDGPYFLSVGTIEPRKNHALLLGIWKHWQPTDGPRPKLVIVGNRGWNNALVFAALDEKPADVIELSGLDDDQLIGLITHANALLMPSFAEGFGLPMVEAASLGTPIIANDLPVYREFLQNTPIYLGVNENYRWKNQIKTLIMVDKSIEAIRYDPPTWDGHFNIVLSEF